jgi:hypothetical protein
MRWIIEDKSMSRKIRMSENAPIPLSGGYCSAAIARGEIIRAALDDKFQALHYILIPEMEIAGRTLFPEIGFSPHLHL